MKKPINKEHIEGYVYDHDLSVRTVQSQTKADGTPNPNYGKEFIAGKLDVQTDEEGVNIVTINFIIWSNIIVNVTIPNNHIVLPSIFVFIYISSYNSNVSLYEFLLSLMLFTYTFQYYKRLNIKIFNLLL